MSHFICVMKANRTEDPTKCVLYYRHLHHCENLICLLCDEHQDTAWMNILQQTCFMQLTSSVYEPS
jgi:hypothetical protein